ncbi:hypothetical protein C0581_04960 [Candidatus Parcubacteria bacterium]|nr:MAG: hypothetical protein C0581_04960 [Candidatus Parcubacteria bacterium]
MKSYRYHLIKNFEENASVFKKIFGNIIFLIGVTKVTWRKNNLTPQDYKNALKIIQKGDMLLVGNHRRASGLFIRGPVTHACIYTGGGRVIHAVSDGVVREKFRNFFSEYDTLAILRPRLKKHKKTIIKKTVRYARKQIGKPFDFFFASKQQQFFCSQLVNDAYHQAGFNTGLANHKKAENVIEKNLLMVTRALHPKEFFNGNFDTIFLSESLKDIEI